MKLNDLSGKSFGYLYVVERDTTYKKRPKWICKCKCGTITSVQGDSLISGHTTSCGCKMFESKNKTHGMRHTRLYSIWCDIKKRCYNTNNHKYKTYGNLGISMCDEWKESFECFL